MYYIRKIPEPFQKKEKKRTASAEETISILHAEEKKTIEKNHSRFPLLPALFVLHYFSPQKKDG